MKVAKKRNIENIFIGAVVLLWLLTVVLPPELITGKDSKRDDSDVVFEDDFSLPSPLSGWAKLKPTQGNEEDVAWSNNGAFRMYKPSSASGNLQVSSPKPDSIGDASVEVDATRISDDTGELASWGVTCRDAAITEGDLYFLGIFSDGSLFIAKYNDYEASILAEDGPTGVINKGTLTNHIRGDCVGSKLTLYVNHQKLLETEDAEFASGGVGLSVARADISFDNFLVSRP